MVARQHGRHLVRRGNLASAHVVCWAIAAAMVTRPAVAEWDTTVDRGIIQGIHSIGNWQLAELEDINAQTAETNGNVIAIKDNSWNILLELQDIATDVSEINSIVESLDQNTDELETLVNIVATLDASIISTLNQIKFYSLDPIVTDVAAIEALLQTIADNTEFQTPSASDVTAPPAPAEPGIAFVPAGLVGPNDVNAPVYLNQSIDIEDPDEPDLPTEDALEWDPPSVTGKQFFDVDVNLGPLTSVFGGAAGTINLGTDLSWYGGAPRTAVHAGITAFVGVACGWLIFQEFKRMA